MNLGLLMLRSRSRPAGGTYLVGETTTRPRMLPTKMAAIFWSNCDRSMRVAGVKTPEAMTGKSLMNVLAASGSGQIDRERNYVLFGKERHVPAQEIGITGGYPTS